MPRGRQSREKNWIQSKAMRTIRAMRKRKTTR